MSLLYEVEEGKSEPANKSKSVAISLIYGELFCVLEFDLFTHLTLA